MIFEAKTITLKNGKQAVLRSPALSDAAEMLDYFKTVSAETVFLLRCPEECDMPVEQEAKFLQNILDSDDTMMIVCEVDGKNVGNCKLSFNSRIRTRHRASVAIAILKEFWGLGIGTAMFREMIAAAEERGVTQMELEFVEGNQRARALYEKMGFHIVAEHPNAIRLEDGTLLRKFTMIRPMK